MTWWETTLIVLAAIALLGPVMLLSARLNKVDPWIFEKDLPSEPSKEEIKSLAIVTILRPLFAPLWIETKIVRWIFKKKNK